jgi:hypothetical protein
MKVRRPWAPAKIVLAYASMMARTSFIWIAKDQGFFAKYGAPDELTFFSCAFFKFFLAFRSGQVIDFL